MSNYNHHIDIQEIKHKKYFAPDSLEEALSLAKKNRKDFKFLAGGTDVMVNKYKGLERSGCLIDLTSIPSLKEIAKIKGFLKIGAMCELELLAENKVLKEEYSGLVEAILSVGSPLIRKTATIGGNVLCENRCLFYNQADWWRDSVGFCLKDQGNICIATGGTKKCYSEMVSDTAPVLISMNAKIEVIDHNGTNIIDLEDVYTGDGINPRNLPDTAIVTAVLIPLGQHYKTVFNKLRLRRSLDFTSLTTAVTVDISGNLKIGISGVDPKVIVVKGRVDGDKALFIKRALKGARAVNNDMYSRNYRRKMLVLFLNQSFDRLKINSFPA